jgi:succinate dehydrogenase / fumarate reductase membrane anchor subunit
LSLRSPLGRVLGSGSAREGTDHWWLQRVSAMAMALLGSWFVLAMLLQPGFDQDSIRLWVGEPWNTVMLLLLGVTLAYHSSLGVQVVIEDYVHAPLLKVVSLVLNKFAHILVAAIATFAVLKIAFGIL